MDYLRGLSKTVLGPSPGDRAETGAETITKLCDRVHSATLLEDRRDAVRALKALSKKFHLEVGTQAMDLLVHVLETDRNDAEITGYALDTLYNIMCNQTLEDEDETSIRNQDDNEISKQFSEIFIKKSENVSTVLDLLEDYDFRIRWPAIKLLTVLLTNQGPQVQHCVLASPQGISKLTDLLSDSREVIRNDALLLLIHLTKGNAAIQKIVAFENAFEQLLGIISEEGYSDGGIVVQDCLSLLLNLLKKNSSNQVFFKEGSYIQKLTPFFDIQSNPSSQESEWSAQKVANIHDMLQVARSLVSPNNPQQSSTACQKVMYQCGLLKQLCDILMTSGVPANILTETINTVAEVIRGLNSNQEYFASVMAPSNPPRPAIVVLLMSMVNEKQPFILRCAVLYCFQCFLYRNEIGQAQIISTLLPKSTEVGNVSAGQLLCGGLFSSDPLSNWCAAVALAHALRDNTSQKEQLLRVQLATGQGTPITLQQQCANMLFQPNGKVQTRAGLLILLSSWLAYSPLAVTCFLKVPTNISHLTAEIAENADEHRQLVQSLCAILLGICLHFNDDSVPDLNKENLKQLISKRIGIDTFVEKLDAISKHESYTKAARKSHIKYEKEEEVLLDYEFTVLYKQLEGHLISTIEDKDDKNEEIKRKTIEDHDSIVNQYKELIRVQDEELNKLKQKQKEFVTDNAELQATIDEQKLQIQQLKDQYALIKVQGVQTTQTELQQQNAAPLEELKELRLQLNSLNDDLNTKNQIIEKLRNDQTVAEAKALLTEDHRKDSNLSMEDNTEKLVNFEIQIKERDEEIESLKTVILEQESEVKQYKTQFQELAGKQQVLLPNNENKQLEIKEMNDGENIASFNALQEELKQKDQQCIQLSQEKQTLENKIQALLEQTMKEKILNEEFDLLKEKNTILLSEKNNAIDEIEKMKKEQDDLLVLLSDQDVKIQKHKKKFFDLGISVGSDEDDGNDDDDDEDDNDEDDENNDDYYGS